MRKKGAYLTDNLLYVMSHFYFFIAVILFQPLFIAVWLENTNVGLIVFIQVKVH
jgi:hypothetical protein